MRVLKGIKINSFCNIYFVITKLFFIVCINLNAQNLIINPDFGDVSIYYRDGKQVYPNHWKSFHWPYPPFSHPAKSLREFPLKPLSIKETNGVLFLYIINPSRGIFTKLSAELDQGQMYEINIRVRIFRTTLNSDITKTAINMHTGKKKDFKDFNFHKIVTLLTKFHYNEPVCMNDENYNLVFLEFPERITPEYSDWITLSSTYMAKGGEKYFSIGSCSTDEYVNYLRKYKSDTTRYDNKISNYLISYVSVFPVTEKPIFDRKFFRSFDPDSVYVLNNKEKFIIRNINFEFDSYELNEVSRNELSDLADFLMNNPNVSLNVIGHTDSIGSAVYNQALSENRAKAVYSFLISKGIKKDRLNWQGRGENEPLDGANYINNFKKHRRVEFEIQRQEP